VWGTEEKNMYGETEWKRPREEKIERLRKVWAGDQRNDLSEELGLKI